MRDVYIFVVALLTGIFSVLANDGLIKLLSDVPKGIIIYKIITGAFIGLIIAVIFMFIDRPDKLGGE